MHRNLTLLGNAEIAKSCLLYHSQVAVAWIAKNLAMRGTMRGNIAWNHLSHLSRKITFAPPPEQPSQAL
jgi:hypothetical protein